jgi:hypothetical protein
MAQTFSRRLQRHGVAPAQWAILLFLYARDGQTQRELSWVVAIEPPTAWSAVSRTLTTSAHPYPAGNQFAARGLSADELETLKTLLRRVIDGLTAEDVKAAGGGDPVRHPGLP